MPGWTGRRHSRFTMPELWSERSNESCGLSVSSSLATCCTCERSERWLPGPDSNQRPIG